MASIKSLYKIAQNAPVEYIKDELKEFRIYEKVDAHSLIIEKHKTSIIVWKRNGTQLLTKIDRILDVRWKSLMLWILNNKENFDERLTYYIDYLPYNKVNQIEYNSLPKNNCILNSVKWKQHNNASKHNLEEISNLLDISLRNEFNNTSDEMIDLILSISQFNHEQINSEEYTNLYSRITDLLSINYTTEGLIIESNNIICKINSPYFLETDKSEPNINYQLLISYMMNFIDEIIGNINFQTNEKSSDRKYIELIDYLFMKWISNPGNLVDIDKPEFIGKINYRECSTNIKNKIQSNNLLSTHYSIMLNAFRKNKNKDWGIFNEEKREQWNKLIFKINKYINKKNGIKPYSEFKNNF